VDVGVARLTPEQRTLLTVVASKEVIYPVYTLVLSVLVGENEELVTENKELVENPEELVLVVTEEEEAEVAEETVDDAVLETDDEVMVEDVLDIAPAALEDEVDDVEELELLVKDPDGVALTELLEEERGDGEI
jgi:hypothetical protein